MVLFPCIQWLFTLCVLVLAPAAHADGPKGPPNVLVIVTDDQGIDQVGVYAEHPKPPPTPNIDALAAEGVLFRNAWASPTCSPSRGSILTGRLPRRTGLGSVIHPQEEYEMPLEEVTIAKMLGEARQDWSTAAIGKWHLAGPSSPHAFKHPNLMGFDHFAGTLANIGEATKDKFGDLSYEHWEKVTNGKRTVSEVYATTENVNDALELMETLPEPWLIYVAFNAPHAPWHVPPKRLHNQDLSPKSGDAAKYRAMVEALDTEIGRLVDGMGKKRRENTTILFLSDNGTPDETTVQPWDKDRAKNTPFEGGVNVPLIVTGPQVGKPGSESAALVHVADVFATVADIANVPIGPKATGVMEGVRIDGRSLLPHLRDPTTAGREVVFTEKFSPNGLGPKKRVDWRISRNAELKIIDTSTYGRLIYDIRDGMDQDPPLDPEQIPRDLVQSYEALKKAHLKQFGEAPPSGKKGVRGRESAERPSRTQGNDARRRKGKGKGKGTSRQR